MRALSLRFTVRRLMMLVAVLAVFSSCAAWYWKATRRGWTEAKLDRLIRAEVPPNGDRIDAEAWFDRHGILHAYFKAPIEDRIGGRTVPEAVGLDPSTLGGAVRGVLSGPGVNVSLFSSGEICVYFFLDGNGRIACYFIDIHIKSP